MPAAWLRADTLEVFGDLNLNIAKFKKNAFKITFIIHKEIYLHTITFK